MMRDINLRKVNKALGCGFFKIETGLNQEQCLQRPRDTHWSSHYKSIRSLVNLFTTLIKVLEFVQNEPLTTKWKEGKARLFLCTSSLLNLSSILHLMLTINYSKCLGQMHCNRKIKIL
jgi:hypothetical protein